MCVTFDPNTAIGHQGWLTVTFIIAGFGIFISHLNLFTSPFEENSIGKLYPLIKTPFNLLKKAPLVFLGR